MALFDAGSSAYQGGTVTTSATAIFSVTGLTSPRDVTVLNQGTAAIYVGGGTVTTTSGVQLVPGAQMTVQGAAQNLWGITAAGSAVTAAGLATTAVVI